jgi:hypothetical protein
MVMVDKYLLMVHIMKVHLKKVIKVAMESINGQMDANMMVSLMVV